MDWRKFGRFAFIIPYIITPPIAVFFENEDLKDALIYTFLFPIFEGPLVLLFIIGWILSISCTISLGKEAKSNHDEKAVKTNKIIKWGIFAILIVNGLFFLYMMLSLLNL